MAEKLILLTPTELRELVADALRDALKDYLPTAASLPTEDRWLTIKELSEYLPGKPAVTTLYGKVQRREMPHQRMGKRLTFRKSEIDQWLKSKGRTTQVDINAAAEQYVSTSKKGRK